VLPSSSGILSCARCCSPEVLRANCGSKLRLLAWRDVGVLSLGVGRLRLRLSIGAYLSSACLLGTSTEVVPRSWRPAASTTSRTARWKLTWACHHWNSICDVSGVFSKRRAVVLTVGHSFSALGKHVAWARDLRGNTTLSSILTLTDSNTSSRGLHVHTLKAIDTRTTTELVLLHSRTKRLVCFSISVNQLLLEPPQTSVNLTPTPAKDCKTHNPYSTKVLSSLPCHW